MSCERLRVQIVALVDGGLEPGEAQEVQAHLASCGPCREFYREQVQLNDWLEQAASFQLEPPAQIWGRIESKITGVTEYTEWDGRTRRLFRGISDSFRAFRDSRLRYAAAGLLVLLLGSWTLLNLVRTPRDQKLLAQLDAYSLPVTGNPFLSEIPRVNPFLSLESKTDQNPFVARGQK